MIVGHSGDKVVAGRRSGWRGARERPAGEESRAGKRGERRVGLARVGGGAGEGLERQ
jgi:hypothetical protein